MFVFNSDFKKFENGLNENLGLLVYNISTASVNLSIAFVYGWKLALVMLAISPVMLIGSVLTTKVCAD